MDQQQKNQLELDDQVSSSTKKPAVPEKPKDLKTRSSLHQELSDASDIVAVESPNYASKPRSTREPPPIPSRPVAFVKKNIPANMEVGKGKNFSLKGSEDFSDSKSTLPPGNVSQTNFNNNSSINPSNSTSFAPSQQFTPIQGGSISRDDVNISSKSLYETAKLKILMKFGMEEKMEANRRTEQEKRWKSGPEPSQEELQGILADRKRIDEDFIQRRSEAMKMLELQFNATPDPTSDKTIGASDESTPTNSRFAVNKGPSPNNEALNSMIQNNPNNNDSEDFSVTELTAEEAASIVDKAFGLGTPNITLKDWTKDVVSPITLDLSAANKRLNHPSDTLEAFVDHYRIDSLDDHEIREQHEAVIASERRKSEAAVMDDENIQIPSQLPETLDQKTLPNAVLNKSAGSDVSKPKMAFAYIRIYDYVTNLYKTMVVKPQTTVKDLLTNALKKSNNIDADAELNDYHIIESLTTGDSRVMDLSENMMQSMQRFSDPTIGVFFYFRKGLSNDRVNPIQYFEKAMDESRKMDEKQRLASQKLAAPKTSSQTAENPATVVTQISSVKVSDNDTTPTNSIPNLKENPKNCIISKDSIYCVIYRYKSVGIKGWKRRILVLEPQMKRNLLFYRSEKDAIPGSGESAVLDINLALVDTISPSPLEADSFGFQDCGFVINTIEPNGYPIYLMALDRSIRDSLIEMIESLKMLVKAKYPNILNPPAIPVAILLTPSINETNSFGSVKAESNVLKSLTKKPLEALTSMMTSTGKISASRAALKTRIIIMDRKVNELTEMEYDVFRGLTSNSLITFMEEKGIITASKLTPLLRGIGISGAGATGNSGSGILTSFIKAAISGDKRGGNGSTCSSLFGVSLESLHELQDGGGQPSKNPWAQLVRSTRQHSNHLIVPRFLEVAIKILLERGLNTSGIFRIPGSRRRMESFKKQIEEGKFPLNWSEISVHDISGLVKLYLRELPEPLLSYKFYKLLVGLESVTPESEKIQALKNIMYHLPRPHRHVLECLVSFLGEIAKYSDKAAPITQIKSVNNLDDNPGIANAATAGVGEGPSEAVATTTTEAVTEEGNRMNSDNLAVVVGPNILRGDKPENDSSLSPSGAAMPTMLSPQAAVREMENIKTATWVLKLLIDNCDSLWTIPRDTMEKVMTAVSGEDEA